MSDEVDTPEPGGGSGLSATGAVNKATRERQRRIRLNERFLELAKVLHPGKPPKTDKASNLADAIQIVSQLRTENGQLRQLNKFLEERISNYEKSSSEALIRQAMYQGLNQPQYCHPQHALPQASGSCVIGQPMNGMELAESQVMTATHERPEKEDIQKKSYIIDALSTTTQFSQDASTSAMSQLADLLSTEQPGHSWASRDAKPLPWLQAKALLPEGSNSMTHNRPPAA